MYARWATSEKTASGVNIMLGSVEPSKSNELTYLILLGWESENTAHAMFCSAAPSKHNNATPVFPAKSENTMNATIRWDGPTQTL